MRCAMAAAGKPVALRMAQKVYLLSCPTPLELSVEASQRRIRLNEKAGPMGVMS